ncbi:hypothetical protein [Sphingobium indicum]
MTAARETRWRQNQSCEAIIACGTVAYVLAGAVRKFAIRRSGQRQIIDLAVAGDFLGFGRPIQLSSSKPRRTTRESLASHAIRSSGWQFASLP